MSLALRDRLRRLRRQRQLNPAVWVEQLEERALFSAASDYVNLAVSYPTIDVGAGETFAAQVLPAAGDIPHPTGTVTFVLGAGTTLGMATVLSDGYATFRTSLLPTGIDEITASYGGDDNYLASSSLPAALTVEDHLAFVVQPSNTTAGQVMSPSVEVELKGANGLMDATNDSNVTIAIAGGPAGGTFTSTSTLTVAAVDGTATFSNLSISKAGTYSFVATQAPTTASAATAARSNVRLIFPDSASAQLVVVRQPLPDVPVLAGISLATPVIVDVEDPYGNIVSSNGSLVTISVVTGSGTLTNDQVHANTGVAEFTALKISAAGTYTLMASATNSSAATFEQTVAQTTVAAPLARAFYIQGRTITLDSALQQFDAPAYTGTATLVGNGQTLGAVNVSSGGGIQFVLTDLAAGSYSCTVNYAGDSHHSAAASPTFTLNVQAPTVTLTNLVARFSHPLPIAAGTAVGIETQILNTGNVSADGGLEIDVSLATMIGGNLTVEQTKTQYISVDIGADAILFATVGMGVSGADPAGVYYAIVTVDGNVNFSAPTAPTPVEDNDVETAPPTPGQIISPAPANHGQTSISSSFVTIE